MTRQNQHWRTSRRIVERIGHERSLCIEGRKPAVAHLSPGKDKPRVASPEAAGPLGDALPQLGDQHGAGDQPFPPCAFPPGQRLRPA